MKRNKWTLLHLESKSEKCIFISIIAVYLILLIARVASGNFYLVDSFEYISIAKKIQAFTFFEQDAAFSIFSKRPIVYPLFLSLLIYVHPFVVLLVQSIIGCISVLILFRVLNDFGVKPNKWFLAFFVLTPSLVIYTQLFMSEWLIFFFLSTLFYLLTRKEFSKKNFALIQLITLFLAFTKPVFYPLIYLNLLFFSVYFIKIKKFSFWLFVPIIVLQLYFSFNEKTSGFKYFSTIENINLINYNLYYFKSTTQSAEVADAWIDSVYSPQYELLNAKQQNEYLKNMAYTEIKSNLFSYSSYHVMTAVRGIFDPGRFDLMTFFKKEDGKQGFLEIFSGKKPLSDLFTNKLSYVYVLLIPIGLANLLKLFYACTFFLTRRLDVRLYYLIATLLMYVLLTGPVNCSRYMMPLQGILIVFAVLGMKLKKSDKAAFGQEKHGVGS